MVDEIRIYVEGGGRDKDSKADVREGFSEFLKVLREDARRSGIEWHIIACGPGGQAFHAFQTALREHPGAVNLLLIDSEGPVSGGSWAHLQNQFGWTVPKLDDDCCHLMVQVMETWLIADIEALKRFYGQDFLQSGIPQSSNLEETVTASLQRSKIKSLPDDSLTTAH